MKPRILLCDDSSENYGKLKAYLENEGFEVSERVDTEEGVRSVLRQATESRQFFHLVMLDIELGRGRPSGIDVYFRLLPDFPNESFVIYSSADVEAFRSELSRLMYRDVVIVLLEEILQRSIHLHLQRVIRQTDPRQVFFVHGRHRTKNTRMRALLHDLLGLGIVEWEDARERVAGRDYIYEIVLRGMEMSHATVVLFTDEEEVRLNKSLRRAGESEPRRQSRPNVYIEAGYAFGVRPKRTLLVEWPRSPRNFATPSDFSGVHTVRFEDTPRGRRVLRARLESARCLLNPVADWETAKLPTRR